MIEISSTLRLGQGGLSIGSALALGGSSGPTPPTTLELLQADLDSSAKSGIWLPTRFATTYTDDGVTPVTAGQQIYRVDDLSGNGNHARQATSNQRPVATDGMTFDNIDDVIGFPFSGGAGAAAMRLIVPVKTTDDTFILISNTGNSPFAIRGVDGNGTTTELAGGTLIVDGVTIGSSISRDACHDAIATGDWVIVVLRGADLTTWGGFQFGCAGGIVFGGAQGGGVLFNEADVADPAATEALAVQLMQEELGL